MCVHLVLHLQVLDWMYCFSPLAAWAGLEHVTMCAAKTIYSVLDFADQTMAEPGEDLSECYQLLSTVLRFVIAKQPAEQEMQSYQVRLFCFVYDLRKRFKPAYSSATDFVAGVGMHSGVIVMHGVVFIKHSNVFDMLRRSLRCLPAATS